MNDNLIHAPVSVWPMFQLDSCADLQYRDRHDSDQGLVVVFDLCIVSLC